MSTYCVGLTGGVASGKSLAAGAFAALGVKVFDADAIARELVRPGQPALAEIVASFGRDVLAADDSLDRAALRRRVFEDTTARARLEAILHPRIRTALQAACEQADGPYVVAAIPLLAEAGGRAAYPWLQRIVLIDVPQAVQVQRLIQRDGIDTALARRMIAAQATREQRMGIADDIIVNIGSRAELAAHVASLDRLYRALAAERQGAGAGT
ncbi:MAG TPA: dephospho-CoA kinase [Xanthomonadaceae bacterium]|nr:dephospho-CoA kinase [Xanthomonadaceae bacterium]